MDAPPTLPSTVGNQQQQHPRPQPQPTYQPSRQPVAQNHPPAYGTELRQSPALRDGALKIIAFFNEKNASERSAFGGQIQALKAERDKLAQEKAEWERDRAQWEQARVMWAQERAQWEDQNDMVKRERLEHAMVQRQLQENIGRASEQLHLLQEEHNKVKQELAAKDASIAVLEARLAPRPEPQLDALPGVDHSQFFFDAFEHFMNASPAKSPGPAHSSTIPQAHAPDTLGVFHTPLQDPVVPTQVRSPSLGPQALPFDSALNIGFDFLYSHRALPHQIADQPQTPPPLLASAEQHGLLASPLYKTSTKISTTPSPEPPSPEGTLRVRAPTTPADSSPFAPKPTTGLFNSVAGPSTTVEDDADPMQRLPSPSHLQPQPSTSRMLIIKVPPHLQQRPSIKQFSPPPPNILNIIVKVPRQLSPEAVHTGDDTDSDSDSDTSELGTESSKSTMSVDP